MEMTAYRKNPRESLDIPYPLNRHENSAIGPSIFLMASTLSITNLAPVRRAVARPARSIKECFATHDELRSSSKLSSESLSLTSWSRIEFSTLHASFFLSANYHACRQAANPNRNIQSSRQLVGQTCVSVECRPGAVLEHV